MISYQEALEIITKNSGLISTENIPLKLALGKVSATEVFSKISVPSFCNSAMDGFAVRSDEIKLASLTNKKQLKIVATIPAGGLATKNDTGAVQIMTGAPIPKGYDAVIPIEDTELDGENVIFKRSARKNENIRFMGEDIEDGQLILCKNKKITPENIMLLAATGVNQVLVYKTPSLMIFSTGNEISDDYNKELSGSKIYNSNSPYLLAKACEEDLKANYGGIIEDNPAKFEEALSQIPNSTVIISTGAVSKGKWDFIPESLKNLGASIHFHLVNIRPGKPILFATLPNGNFFFGLPGNPVSTAVGFSFFVIPLLRKLQGLSIKPPLFAVLKNNFVKKGNFRQFLKANLNFSDNGQLYVSINDGQESFKISPLAQSNCWVILEEKKIEYYSGDLVQVISTSFMI